MQAKHKQYLQTSANKQSVHTFTKILPCVHVSWTTIIVALSTLFLAAGEDTRPTHRVTPYEVLVEDKSRTNIYSHPNIEGYLQMTLDPTRDQIIVGARDYVLRLSLNNLTVLEKPLQWQPDTRVMNTCVARGQPKANCCNYIKVLLLDRDRVLVCGTNAFSPHCTWRNALNLTTVIKDRNVDSKAAHVICPINPKHNSTALMTSNGDLYTAMAQDSVILRAFGPSKPLRTVEFNSKWLNEPEFVSSYEIGDFVYFFFRETAVEFMNCGKTVYSRVVRVCKNDGGGRIMLEDNWTSFQKARINCSISGEYPFYFHHLQSTHYVKKEGLIYMVFNTATNSIYGSAVCVYDIASINKAFSGSYKYQPHANNAWIEKPNPTPTFKCSSKRSMSDSIKFQLMNEAVQPLSLKPIALIEQNRWSHIVVDSINAKHHNKFQVVFLGNLDGVIEKRIQLPYSNQSCIIEQINLFPRDAKKKEAIKSMRIHNGKLYIITETKIMQVPVDRCHLFKNKVDCMDGLDPYCGWDANKRQCTTAPGSNPKHHRWHQHPITRCPKVHGGWSKWSKWFKCKQTGSGTHGENCMCRTRTCDTPAPSKYGRNCQGNNIEVSKCTVHGRWTKWSEWSACTATCGLAVRTKQRECGNPKPANGGRNCVGDEIVQDICKQLPCPKPTESPLDGGWSSWSGWSQCTHKCGGGMKNRMRSCNEPTPNKYGRPCSGNNEEWRRCNIDACPELTVTKSTPWVRLLGNSNTGSCKEARYVINCKASMEDSRLLRFAPNKEEERPCNSDVTVPGTRMTVDGQWSAWTEWGPCDKVCGGGIKQRRRSCDSPSPVGNGLDCPGSSVQNRECNTHSCQADWSCWSEFSACSVTCGTGIKWRRRQCKGNTDGKRYLKSCLGQEREEDACVMPSCDDVDGWSDWSLWSDCEGDTQTQVRHRKCLRTFPEHCQGLGTQTRACNPEGIASESRQGPGSQYTTAHVVVVGLVTFLLGVVIAVISLYVYYIKVIKNKKPPMPKNMWLKNTNETSKPNLYSFPRVPSVPSNIDLNNKYNSYSTGSLNRGTLNRDKMTVKEATLKRDSLMRTNLSLNDL